MSAKLKSKHRQNMDHDRNRKNQLLLVLHSTFQRNTSERYCEVEVSYSAEMAFE